MFKYLFYISCFIVGVFVGTKSFAQELCELNDQGICVVETEKLEKETKKEETPKAFEDSAIKRKMKDGSIQEFDGDKYKIVPRTQTRYTKKVVKKEIAPVVITRVKKRRHHLNLMIGNAPDEYIRNFSTGPNSQRVEHEHSFTLGLSYSYDLLELSEDVDLSIGGMVLSNDTYMGSIGISF